MSDIKLPEPYYGIARRDGGADIAGPWVSIEQLHAYAEARAKQAAELERERLYRLVADDAWAITFQTFGQYRTALLKAIRGTK